MLGRCDNRYTTETLGSNSPLRAQYLPVNAGTPIPLNWVGVSMAWTNASRDRLVVRTLRCGRSNPGSNPGHGSDILLGITMMRSIDGSNIWLQSPPVSVSGIVVSIAAFQAVDPGSIPG